jgi:hypothetical protein
MVNCGTFRISWARTAVATGMQSTDNEAIAFRQERMMGQQVIVAGVP